MKIDPGDARALADCGRRKQFGIDEPGVPAEHVEAYLQRLHTEWETKGPFDRNKADEILSQMNVRVD